MNITLSGADAPAPPKGEPLAKRETKWKNEKAPPSGELAMPIGID